MPFGRNGAILLGWYEPLTDTSGRGVGSTTLELGLDGAGPSVLVLALARVDTLSVDSPLPASALENSGADAPSIAVRAMSAGSAET